MDDAIITDEDREEIGRQVSQGYTSGRLDSEDGTKIAWAIKMQAWQD